ncbi:MAG TPA: hypothetical protein VIW03_08615 [Anaeromyxobacter sp.]|jgi:hypothetical protein
MASKKRMSPCRRCGADALASPGSYVARVREGVGDGAHETVMHLCGPCGREFASDSERDEYVRLGLMA